MTGKPSPQQLQEIKFLQNVPVEYLEKVATISQFRGFKKGDVLFDEGDTADKLYLIVSGTVLLQACSEATGCKPIMTIGKGELLGWSALVDKCAYVAKALVTEPLEVIELDGAKLKALFENDPRFGYDFLRRMVNALAKRLSVTWKQVAEVCVTEYLPLGAKLKND
jgi:CRP-like cAMP-binding protein